MGSKIYIFSQVQTVKESDLSFEVEEGAVYPV